MARRRAYEACTASRTTYRRSTMPRGSTPRRAAVAVAGLIGGLLAVGIATPSVGARESTDVVSASVAPGSLTDARASYFVIPRGPGARIDQSIIVTNPYDRPLLVDIAAVDATTGAQTGASYGTPGSGARHTARWIAVRQRQLKLGPLENRTVGFTVTIPNDATPGQYLAGISASVARDTTSAKPEAGNSEAAFAIRLRSQRVIAVEVDVPGATAPDLVVTKARPVARSDMINLALSIENRGNAFAHGTGLVSAPATGFRKEFKIDTFVSHTAIEMTIPWTRNAKVGRHEVRVQLAYEDGRRANWSGVIEISEELRAKLDKQLLRDNAETSKPAEPASKALKIGGGAAAVAVCSACALHLRRRRSFAGAANGRGLL